MNENEKSPRSSSLNRRSFMGCAALSGLGLLTVGTANAETTNTASTEEAVKTAVAKEKAKAFEKRIAHDANYLKPLVKEFGEPSLENLKRTTINQTRESYQKRDLARRDLQAVKDLLWNHLKADKYEIEKIQDTGTVLEYRVKRCIHADTWRKKEAGEIGFAMTCCWDYGFCEGLNPDIVFTRSKTLMQGDCCCNHRYELPTEKA